MKHFMDIENIREEDVYLGNDITRRNNVGAFQVGDHISIQEKIDGSNASFTYEDGILKAFSRKQELNFSNTLRGFWNWVQTLNAEEYAEDSRYIYFGEWLVRNKVVYNQDAYCKFYFYDIFDKVDEVYMPQDFVKEQSKKHNLIYVHEFYNGPFISWEHCRSFMNSPGYGDRQEGIIVKSATKLNDDTDRQPFYLKIVNEDFKETMKNREPKEVDPEVEAARANALSLIEQVVTRNRVEKMIRKLVDEGVLPTEITPKDMGVVARNIPKRIYEDCVKEEPEIIQAAGEFGGKLCNQVAMKIAREVILGG